MRRFFSTVIGLLFLLQPLAAGAATFTAPVFHSPSIIRQQYMRQEQTRLAQHLSFSMQQTYTKVGDYTPALPADGLTIGLVSAPVIIVEFIDYGSVSGAQFEMQTVPMLKTQYINAGKVRFVVRNFPLSYHPAANVAALAVECSRDQNERFGWMLHDALLAVTAAHNGLTEGDVYQALQSITGIDTEKLYYCIDTKAKQGVLDKDAQDAVNGGINTPPSFWVLGKNGKAELIQGTVSSATWQKVIAGMQ